MPPPSRNAVRTWRPIVHLLPTEILSIIFLLVVEEDDETGDRVRLMLVCRYWYAIMLSTPGIPSYLRIDKSTTMEIVRAAIQGTKWLLDVTIDIYDKSTGQDFNSDAFDACRMSAIEVASRCKSLLVTSFPPPGEWKAFQIVPPLKNLESSGLSQDCDIGSVFGLLMTAITTTATPRLTNISLWDPIAVLYLVQPDCTHIFCSLTSLAIWLSKRMESPVNILPHLQRLEFFQAQHLCLPIYPYDSPLPLTQTLRRLYLTSVSIQWMAGKVFPVLQLCHITFPHQSDTLCLQPVTMPACTSLGYNSNDIDPLRCFHDLPLAELTVESGQWNVPRGNLQLIAICRMIIPHAHSLTVLDIQVRCSGQLLTYMLSLLPALKVLTLGLASPRALNEAFFQTFVATNANADIQREVGAPSRLPLCSKLVELRVRYKRWLRDSERTALLSVFGGIASSRQLEEDFELCLNFEGLAQNWVVLTHIESIRDVELVGSQSVIGVSSPLGIIPLVNLADEGEPLAEVPFKEAEYLVPADQLSIDCLLSLHNLMEIRLEGGQILASEPPSNLPLFHTLRVLEARGFDPSFLAGQTFYKLERCRMFLFEEDPPLSEDEVTQMPICTRLDVNDLTLLATLKLPRICELGVPLDHPEFNMIWENHIRLNTNLSGLELLHVHNWCQQADLIQALQCLPVLKSLILSEGPDLDAAFFGEFLPMHLDENAVLMQSYDEVHISTILCPMLSSLLIEEWDPTEHAELIPVLKQVVTLRVMCCSPLTRFTLSAIKFPRKFELIGSQGGLVTEMGSMDEDSGPLSLDIWLMWPGCSVVDFGKQPV